MYHLPDNRMLIVDNDPLQLSAAIKNFQKAFHIQTAISGYEALEVLENEHIDVLLLDLNLGDPQMDGCRVMRTIRQSGKFKYIKIIALSTYVGARDWYVSEGFDELFVKPLKDEKLIDIIHDLQYGNEVWWALNRGA